MNTEIQRIQQHLKTLPFCKTFFCLCKKEKLEDGVMPAWFTKIVNWLAE